MHLCSGGEEAHMVGQKIMKANMDIGDDLLNKVNNIGVIMLPVCKYVKEPAGFNITCG